MLQLFRVTALTLTALILSGGCDNKEAPLSQITPELDSFALKVEWLDYRLTEENWEYHKAGHSDSLQFYQELYRIVLARAGLLKNPAETYGRIIDRTERRRFQLLLGATLSDRIEITPGVATLKDSLQSAIRSYRIDFQGKDLSLGEVERIYHRDRNRSQRELACRAVYALSDSLDEPLSDLFIERNKQAVQLGFRNYFDLTMFNSSLGNADFLSLINQIDSLTQDYFTDILNKARRTAGVNQLEIWDMPYVYSQINQRADNFFPFDSQLNFIKAGLKSVGFDLNNLPIYLETPGTYQPALQPTIFIVKAPVDTRILTDTTAGFNNTQLLLKEIGKALNATHIAEDKPLYNFAVEEVWQMAMAEIIATISYDSLWLNDVVNMPVGFISQFRQARLEQELIRIRQLLVDLHFEYEAYENPNRDLNKLYWDLYQKYTGLPRHQNIKLWAVQRQFISAPMQSLNILLAKAIAAQSVNYMQKYLGEIAFNDKTSSFLVQNYYRFGSRYNWPELLQRGTGEKLNPVHLINLLQLSAEP